MNQSRDFKESMDKFERLFRGVVAQPKAEVVKEEAKEKSRNRKLREKRKAAKKPAKA